MARALVACAVLSAAAARALELSSPAFAPGGAIPAAHTCDGADRSPPLAWKGTPAATRSFALVCEDPDAPAGTWVHWVLYDLPASTTSLPAGIEPRPTLPDGSRQGVNDFRKHGHGGPCPPRGASHRYVFTLYALDAPLALPPGASKAELLAAMRGHVRGTAELIGRYQRP